jgi:ubiquinone/menaquinone biosynthesis C-methylase UbiE
MLEDQREYWDTVAEEKYFTTPLHIDVFTQNVPLDAKILDFGCGYGRTLFKLYRHGFTNAVGIDFSEKMIGRGKSIHPYLNLLHYSGAKFPFEDNSFDVVLGLGVFTCIPKDRHQVQMIKEIKRVLKPNGYIYINDFLITENKQNRERYEQFLPKYKVYGIFELPGGGVFRHHSREWFDDLLSDLIPLTSEDETFKTMNGVKTDGIFFFGQYRGKRINKKGQA